MGFLSFKLCIIALPLHDHKIIHYVTNILNVEGKNERVEDDNQHVIYHSVFHCTM